MMPEGETPMKDPGRRFLKQPKWVILLLLIAAVAVAGILWLRSNITKAPDYSLSAQPALNTSFQNSCLQTRKDEILCRYLATGEQTVPYEATLVTKTTASTMTTTFKADSQNEAVVAKDASGKEVSSAIRIGSTGYIKDEKTGKWRKLEVDPKASSNPLKAGKDLINSQQNDYKSLGVEACGLLECYKYQAANTKSKITYYFWFDTHNYVLRRYSTTHNNVTTELTIDYRPVTITAPAT